MKDGYDYIHANLQRAVWRTIIFFIWGGKDFLKDIKDFTYEKVLSIIIIILSQCMGGSKALGTANNDIMVCVIIETY